MTARLPLVVLKSAEAAGKPRLRFISMVSAVGTTGNTCEGDEIFEVPHRKRNKQQTAALLLELMTCRALSSPAICLTRYSI